MSESNIINTLRSKFRQTAIFVRYAIFRYAVMREFARYWLMKNCSIAKVCEEGINFFGYYNIPPENNQNDICYLNVPKESVRASADEIASIMLKKHNGETVKLAETRSWNWQQGCMMQWLSDSDNIIYNDFDLNKNCYISRVIDIKGNIIREYSRPINAVSANGMYALSLNYERLAVLRPDYGYFCKEVTVLPDDNNDGIWYLDLKSGSSSLIISLEQLKNASWSSTMEGAAHKVNHIMINPSTERFMFLHRWIGPKGRFTRLISANYDGTDISILNGDIMTSHACWVDNDTLLAYCYTPEFGNAYTLFVDKKKEKKLISTKLPRIDGHPVITNDGRWLITDDYPQVDRMSHLYLYDMRLDELCCLGRFYQPHKYYGEKRIDLHPKLNSRSNRIYFESGHDGQRNLYLIEKKSN